MKKNILIADDNQEITRILADYVRHEGYIPHIASDGEMALKIFADREIAVSYTHLINKTKAKTSFQEEPNTCVPVASSNPRSIPPSMAPGRDPIPVSYTHLYCRCRKS